MSEDRTIEKLVPGGDALLRFEDGRVGLIKGALPGERIRVLAKEHRKGVLRVLEWQLLAESPARVEPPCPVAFECGGCDWMHLEYSAQKSYKAEILKDALERVGKIRGWPASIPVVSAGSPLRYRNRARFQVGEKGEIGFFARGTRRVVQVPGCLVLRPELDLGLRTLREVCQRYPGAVKQVSELELCSSPPAPPLLRITARQFELDDCQAWLRELAGFFQISVAGKRAAAPTEPPSPEVSGAELCEAAPHFTQANWEVNLELTRAIVAGAQAREVRRFCDLYCGAGNLTLPLGAAGLEGVGIEVSAVSVALAARASHERGLSRVHFVAGDAKTEVGRLVRAGERFDLVLLDPPRAGARSVLPGLLALAPTHIAYCSCDPVTMARDLKHLTSAGFALEELCGYDMFPQTHHLETLAWLRRSTKVC